MRKLFVSQPMDGLNEEEILVKRNTLCSLATRTLGEDLELLESYVSEIPEGSTPLSMLAQSLKYLAQADVVIFDKDWTKSRGCRIEYNCAIAYEVPILLLENTCGNIKI